LCLCTLLSYLILLSVLLPPGTFSLLSNTRSIISHYLSRCSSLGWIQTKVLIFVGKLVTNVILISHYCYLWLLVHSQLNPLVEIMLVREWMLAEVYAQWPLLASFPASAPFLLPQNTPKVWGSSSPPAIQEGAAWCNPNIPIVILW
jgi:hypothetical protein